MEKCVSRELIASFATLTLLIAQAACLAPLFDTGQSATAAYNTLLLKFESAKTRPKVGEAVHMRFSITNTGNQTQVIESKDFSVMDIVLEEPPGRRILVSWSTQNPDKVSHRVEWKRGESKTLELVWTLRHEDYVQGATHDIFLTGILSENSKIVQSTGVTICAGSVCRYP